MERYIARELKEDIKYLIKKTTELNEKMDNKKQKEELYGKNYKQIGDYPLDARPNDPKLLDNFDWAALGIAACGIVLLINVIMGVM